LSYDRKVQVGETVTIPPITKRTIFFFENALFSPSSIQRI